MKAYPWILLIVTPLLAIARPLLFHSEGNIAHPVLRRDFTPSSAGGLLASHRDDFKCCETLLESRAPPGKKKNGSIFKILKIFKKQPEPQFEPFIEPSFTHSEADLGASGDHSRVGPSSSTPDLRNPSRHKRSGAISGTGVTNQLAPGFKFGGAPPGAGAGSGSSSNPVSGGPGSGGSSSSSGGSGSSSGRSRSGQTNKPAPPLPVRGDSTTSDGTGIMDRPTYVTKSDKGKPGLKSIMRRPP